MPKTVSNQYFENVKNLYHDRLLICKLSQIVVEYNYMVNIQMWDLYFNNMTEFTWDFVTVTVLFMHISLYTMSEKKPSHFNFRHNFATCWDIFTIFEAPCSGLISASYSVLHTHHWHKAFNWRDIAHDVSQTVAALRLVLSDTRLHITWLIASEFTGLKSSWLLFLEYYYTRGSVPDTHSEYRQIETLASSGVSRAGPPTYRCSYRTVVTPSQCVWHVRESWMGIFWRTVVMNLHVALWSICWIVGLFNA